MKPIIIAIAGGSGSGKTTFAEKIKEVFTSESLLLLQDDYYKDQSDKFDFDGGSVNFDHPESIDFELLQKHLNLLKQNESIDRPQYDFATHKRSDKFIKTIPKKLIIIDGILLLHPKKLREVFDYKLFTECPEDLRYERRLKRDINERGRTEEGVYKQFYDQVKPMHDKFVKPSKEHADEIITKDSFNEILEKWIIKLKASI